MISLRTLGEVDVRKDGAPLPALLAQPKRLALLVYLAVARPRGVHSRDALLTLFWPGSDAERARNSLRQALHQLRRALGEETLPGRSEREIAVNPDLVRCDAVEFDDAIASGRWEDAIRLYGGDFLPGLSIQEAPEAERWVEAERARRRRDLADATVRLAETPPRRSPPAATALAVPAAVPAQSGHRWLLPILFAVALLSVALAGIFTWRHRHSPAVPLTSPAAAPQR